MTGTSIQYGPSGVMNDTRAVAVPSTRRPAATQLSPFSSIRAASPSVDLAGTRHVDPHTRHDRRGQLRPDLVAEVNAMRAVRIEHHLEVQIAVHVDDAAIARIVVAVRRRLIRLRFGRVVRAFRPALISALRASDRSEHAAPARIAGSITTAHRKSRHISVPTSRSNPFASRAGQAKRTSRMIHISCTA